MEISPSASTIIQTFQNVSGAPSSKILSPRTIIRTVTTSSSVSSTESSSTPSTSSSAIISVTSSTASSTAMSPPSTLLTVQTNGNNSNIEPRISSSDKCSATVFIESKDEFTTAKQHTQDNNKKINVTTQQLLNTKTSNNDNNKQDGGHVVKIRINPNLMDEKYSTVQLIQNYEAINNQINTTRRNNNKSIVNLINGTDDPTTKSNRDEDKDKHSTSTVRINVNSNNLDNDPQLQNGEMIKNTPTVIKHQHHQQQQQQQQQPLQQQQTPTSNYFFYTGFAATCSPTSLIMSSGQCSPSDTLDSGTCSDLDSTPPPLPKKKNSSRNHHSSTTTSTKNISVTHLQTNNNQKNLDYVVKQQDSTGPAIGRTINGLTLEDSSGSEDTESNLSCDSLNSSELNSQNSTNSNNSNNSSDMVKQNVTNMLTQSPQIGGGSAAGFPRGLLQDIRDHRNTVKHKSNTSLTPSTPMTLQQTEQLTSPPIVASVLEKTNAQKKIQPSLIINESTYEERKLKEKQQNGGDLNSIGINEPMVISGNYLYEADRFYKFHLNENIIDECDNDKKSTNSGSSVDDYDHQSLDESFAGYKDIVLGCDDSLSSTTIRSAKGTIRGVKNRVRAGIQTFLQIQQPTVKSYREKDAGKVVVYTTTMGIVRDTYQQCGKVKQILRTHLVKFEERDVFMSSEYQAEIRDRMHSDQILVPQVYVDGQHIGDAEAVERLNETGELRRILKPYKSPDACTTCQVCGGYRLLPCPVCNGSKKSVHRNHFTTEFVALKCMNCDEVGLVRCYAC